MTDLLNAYDAAARDRLYVDKVYQYVADSALDGNVVAYLELMVAEYRQQQRHYDGLGDTLAAKMAEAKAYAYADSLRVLSDAIESALAYANAAID